jgi:ubiquinone/menaquinone biosynthesis C-methylase UbiE
VNLTNRRHVRLQYAHEEALETRRRVWHPAADGRDPIEAALAVIAATGPGRVLEVGCGTGVFAERLAVLPGKDVVATDQSPRFVELTAARGIDAREADVENLPFGDASFDVVYAGWMLYHVPDLDRGLAEIRRVLRPSGWLVAVTNGDRHIAELREEAGGEAVVTQFSSENGEASLRRHFDDVRREDFAPRAVFPDHAAAQAYLDSSDEGFEGRLPHFAGPREYAGHSTVFTAR